MRLSSRGNNSVIFTLFPKNSINALQEIALLGENDIQRLSVVKDPLALYFEVRAQYKHSQKKIAHSTVFHHLSHLSVDIQQSGPIKFRENSGALLISCTIL